MLRKIEPIGFIFGFALIGYSFFSALSGDVSSYERAGPSEIIIIESDPRHFWYVVFSYLSIGLTFLMISMKKYYPEKIHKLLNFGFETNLSWQQFMFVVCYAAINLTVVAFLSKALANT